MPTCSKCGHSPRYSEPPLKFCPQCATPFPEEEFLPFVGRPSNDAVYRITFSPVEGVFSCEEAVLDAVRISHWGEDGRFEGFEIEFVRSVVPTEAYPYICGSCGGCVTANTAGRCSDCGERNWVERD